MRAVENSGMYRRVSGFCEVIYHKENTYSQEMSDGVYLRNYCLSG